MKGCCFSPSASQPLSDRCWTGTHREKLNQPVRGHCSCQQLITWSEPSCVQQAKKSPETLCAAEAVQSLKPFTIHIKLCLLGCIVSSWSSITWKRIDQRKPELWQAVARQPLQHFSSRIKFTEVAGICMVVEYYVSAPPVKLTENVG